MLHHVGVSLGVATAAVGVCNDVTSTSLCLALVVWVALVAEGNGLRLGQLHSACTVVVLAVVERAEGTSLHGWAFASADGAGHAVDAQRTQSVHKHLVVFEADACAKVFATEGHGSFVVEPCVSLAVLNDTLHKNVALGAEPLLIESACTRRTVSAAVVVETAHEVGGIHSTPLDATCSQWSLVLAARLVDTPRRLETLVTGPALVGRHF